MPNVPVPTKSGRFIERDGALIECDADGQPLGVVHERVAAAEPAAEPPKAEVPKPGLAARVFGKS